MFVKKVFHLWLSIWPTFALTIHKNETLNHCQGLKIDPSKFRHFKRFSGLVQTLIALHYVQFSHFTPNLPSIPLSPYRLILPLIGEFPYLFVWTFQTISPYSKQKQSQLINWSIPKHVRCQFKAQLLCLSGFVWWQAYAPKGGKTPAPWVANIWPCALVKHFVAKQRIKPLCHLRTYTPANPLFIY